MGPTLDWLHFFAGDINLTVVSLMLLEYMYERYNSMHEITRVVAGEGVTS